MHSTLRVALVASLLGASVAHADSVAQVGTAKRISRQTVTLIDPQGRTVDGGTSGSDTAIKVGDILTFIIQFTPVPNDAYRGLGGYITDYIPPGTQVVGARIIDRNGNTVRPHRGGLAVDGVGSKGNTFTGNLVPGSMSQLYADSGIFFSTDPLTRRRSTDPSNAASEQPFLTLANGLLMSPSPTGVGKIADLLGSTSPYYAHNEWDRIQYMAFGGGLVSTRGNTPEYIGSTGIGFGSPVAGPQTWYQLAARLKSGQTAATSTANIELDGGAGPSVGPWQRIRTYGSEIGRRGAGASPVPAANNLMPDPGVLDRVGIPATNDGTTTGTLLGFDLNPDNPLPWSDPPAAGTHTYAVRYALGELVVGDEYYAEISLRVKKLPLDPGPYAGYPDGLDINCAEVAGGDASAREQSNPGSGKDHLWRYFLPAPTCVLLNLLFENSVDKLLANANAQVTNNIEVKNLSTSPQTNVVVRDCFDPAEESIVGTAPPACSGSPPSPVPCLDTTAAGCPNAASADAIVWAVGTLMPGETRVFTPQFKLSSSTTNRAVFSSDTVPSFLATAYTTVGDLAVMRLGLVAAPSYLATVPNPVHYTATLQNVGTGTATLSGSCGGGSCMVQVTLPAGFTYKTGSLMVDGVATASNPATALVGGRQVLTFTGVPPLKNLAPGASETLDFDVDVAGTVTTGVYTSAMRTWVSSAQAFEDAINNVAPVAVGQARSDVPTVSSPILDGAKSVSGTTGEAVGTKITIYVNGNPVGSTTTTGGTWSVTVPTLFAGQRVTATATAPGEFEGPQSADVVVSGVGGTPACSDGKDNDGDGKTDYPDDPGCTSASDLDEADVPACSDGVDNDKDGKIDYPADESCSSLLDNDESGPPACNDGKDNDGDGKVDFPDDPGCSSATDVDEHDQPACADGVDNDGDGLVDFPADPGCDSATDNDEANAGAQGGDMSVGPEDLSTPTDGGSSTARPDGDPPDPGGLAAPQASGCSCRVDGTSEAGASLFGFALLLVALRLLSRRPALARQRRVRRR